MRCLSTYVYGGILFDFEIELSTFFCFQVFDSVSSKQVQRCNATRHEEADVCMQKMFLIGDRSQRFRETLPQMKNYCR